MVNLGDEVKDTVSGFQGIAVSRHVYLQGCSRISVQPPAGKDGKLPDTATFDEPLLIVVKAGRVKGQGRVQVTGGPEKYSDGGRR